MVSANDVQRLFLQGVFSRSILSFKHAQVLWEKCIDAVKVANPTLDIRFSDKREDWDLFVISINNSLNCLDLEFRHLTDEQTGREMYAMVNSKDDEIAQMATDYSPVEIAYFKAVVEQIMLAPHEAYSVSSLLALREVNSLKTNMTKAQAEIVLGSFVAKGWLLKSRRGRYSLSTRTLLELLPYLKNSYPEECLECVICYEIITRGVACSTPNCKARLHYHCCRKYRSRNAKCPACSQDWPQDPKNMTPVGEEAIKDGQDEGRRVRRKSTEDGSDDDDDEEEEEEMEVEPSQPSRTQTQSQRKGKGRSKGKGKQKKAPVDMDVDEDEDEEEDEAPQQTQGNGRRRTTRTR
ncbi:Nse1 non-SMC component of SMC5-6 complex-domain-containing protein [Suillus americanus]|nr:Nse1 non-SMC component of SMC5-6 complex-domain-containing protein [Suillus americanus]